MGKELERVLDRLAEAAQPEEFGEPVRFPESYKSLDGIRDVYLGKVQVPPAQLKALIAALPFENPKLAVVASTTVEGLGERLNKAREARDQVLAARAGGRLVELVRGGEEGEGSEEHSGGELAGQFASTISKLNGKS